MMAMLYQDEPADHLPNKSDFIPVIDQLVEQTGYGQLSENCQQLIADLDLVKSELLRNLPVGNPPGHKLDQGSFPRLQQDLLVLFRKELLGHRFHRVTRIAAGNPIRPSVIPLHTKGKRYA